MVWGVNGAVQSSGLGCQKADDTSVNGNGTMTGETQSDSYSLEKGPAAPRFAKILSASVHLLVLHFVTARRWGEMGYCDKHCLTPAVSNSSGYSRPVRSCRCTSLGVFLPWLVKDLSPSPFSSTATSAVWFKLGILRCKNTTLASVNGHYIILCHSFYQAGDNCLSCLPRHCLQ